MKLSLHGFLAPILGAVGGSLISGLFGNAANKANEQNQQNAQTSAQNFNAQELQQMIDFIKSQQSQAFSNLSSYLAKNPLPTQNLPPIALPTSTAPASIGGQTVGPNGTVTGNAPLPAAGNPNANSSLLDAIWPLLLQKMQPPPALTPPPASPAPTNPGNFPRRPPVTGAPVHAPIRM